MEIRTIQLRSNREIPRNVIQDLPRPVVSEIRMPKPVTPPPPVVRGISPPVVNVPDTSIEYPTIDLQTEQDFRGDMSPSQQSPQRQPPPDTRDLSNTPIETQQPSFEVGGVDIPIPDPAPLVAAGSLAVVTTVVTLLSVIGLNQTKSALEPLIKKTLQPKKKKIKLKKVTPVLHFIPSSDGTVELIQYSAKGMKVLEGGIKNIEQYLRDQVDIDALWEYDNKLIIDEEISENLTKDGQKRFKKYFAPPKVIAKKLGAKFSF